MEMHFLPENHRARQHKERAYGKVLAPGGMQVGLCSAFFAIYDFSHGSKMDLGERRLVLKFQNRECSEKQLLFQEINVASPSTRLLSP